MIFKWVFFFTTAIVFIAILFFAVFPKYFGAFSGFFGKNEWVLTFLLVFVTAVYVGATTDILKQQQTEEYTQGRAYVAIVAEDSVTKIKIDDNPQEQEGYLVIPPGGSVNMPFTIENGGLTPATNVTSTSHFLIDGQRVDEFLGNSSESVLNPRAKKDVNINLNVDRFESVRRDSGNSFVVEIKYKDYKNKEHVFISRYYFIKNSDDSYQLRLNNQN